MKKPDRTMKNYGFRKMSMKLAKELSEDANNKKQPKNQMKAEIVGQKLEVEAKHAQKAVAEVKVEKTEEVKETDTVKKEADNKLRVKVDKAPAEVKIGSPKTTAQPATGEKPKNNQNSRVATTSAVNPVGPRKVPEQKQATVAAKPEPVPQDPKNARATVKAEVQVAVKEEVLDEAAAAALQARRDASGFNYDYPEEWSAEVKESLTKMYDKLGVFHEYVFPHEPQTRKAPFIAPIGGLQKCACKPGCKLTLPEPAYRSTTKPEYELFTGKIKKNLKNARKVRKH